MATYKHLRSSTANKRPTTTIVDGQLAINTNTASPGLFFKDSAGTGIVKVGPVHVGTTAPNSVPASGGSTGNYTGEQWLDTSVSPAQMKVWNGSTWVGIVADELPVSKLQDGAARQLIQTDAAGTGVEWTSNVDVPGTLDVTSTATFDSIAQHPLGTAGAPTITFTGDTNTGIYSPGADQVAISTNGAGRVFVNSTGLGVGIAAGRSIDVYKSDAAGSAILRLSDIDSRNVELRSPDGLGNTAGVGSVTNHDFTFFINNTERARLDTNGRLGLGTSAPWSTFTVGSGGTANPAATATIHQNTHSEYRLKLTSSTYNADGNWLGLGFGYSDNYLKAGIIAEVKDGNARTNLHFCLDGNANSDNAGLGDSKMVITYGGNVGIGTNSPTGILEACGSSSYFRPAGAAGTFFQVTAGAANGDVTLTASANSGGYPPLVFSVGGGEAARIDASKRLLVGTSTARANFFNSSVSAISQVEEVGGGSAAYSAITNVAGATGPAFVLGKTRGTSAGSNTVVNSGDQLGTLSFQGSDGSEFVEGAIIRAEVDGTPGANDMPGRLVFSVSQDGSASPTERLRINNIGTHFFFSGGTDTLIVRNANAANTSNEFINCLSDGTGITSGGSTSFRVYTNGNVQNANNSYSGISDAKLKENIVDAGSQWDDLKAFQVRKFNFKEGQTHTQIGLVAQEVELVSPGLVTESPDRDAEGNDLGTVTKSVNYSVLYMKAVKALQEAMERIEQLEAKVAALEGA